MDHIAYLQQSLDNITNQLEDMEKRVSDQTMQIKKVKDDSLSTELKIKKNTKQLRECEQMEETLKLKLAEVENQNLKLEIEHDCLDDSLAQIPLLAAKLGDEFRSFSNDHMGKCCQLTNMAISEEFWIEKCKALEGDIQKEKEEHKERKRYALQAQKSEEARLDHQLQEEEYNLACINSCVEALKTKNEELRLERDKRNKNELELLRSPSYSEASSAITGGENISHQSHRRTATTRTRVVPVPGSPPLEDPEEYWPTHTSVIEDTPPSTTTRAVSQQPAFFEPPPARLSSMDKDEETALQSITSSELNDLLHETPSETASLLENNSSTPWFQQHKRKRNGDRMVTMSSRAAIINSNSCSGSHQQSSAHRVSPTDKE